MEPTNALIFIDGSHYKFGVRDMIFIFGEEGWVRSTREESDVLRHWKKEFMDLMVLPKRMPINNEKRKAKVKKLNEEHRALMAPIIDSGEWKSLPPADAFAKTCSSPVGEIND